MNERVGGAAPRTALSDLTEALLATEKELGLIERRVADAPAWQRIRFEVHRRLIVESGVMGHPEPAGASAWGWLRARLRVLGAAGSRSAFGAVPPCELLFAGGGRRVRDARWGWYSPYCGIVAHGVAREALVVEFRNGPRTPAAPGVATRYLDRLHAASLLRRVGGRPAHVPSAFMKVMWEAASRLERDTGVAVDLGAMVRDDLTRREVELPRYRRLLRRCGARVVVVECSYDKHSVLEAARSLDLPVVELQHGVVSRHHLGYHFPSAPRDAVLFPDWFFAWGEHWRAAADFPLDPRRVPLVGFPRFDRERAMSGGADTGDDVLVLSQAMLGERLSRFTAALAERGLRERIVYRLHPREEPSWRRRHPWLAASGVRVTGAAVPLYPQLRSASVHVGSFSTALFEGMALGADTYLVPAPGVEYMDDVLRAGWATTADTPDALAASIAGARPRSDPPPLDALFRPDSLPRACALLEAIASGRPGGDLEEAHA